MVQFLRVVLIMLWVALAPPQVGAQEPATPPPGSFARKALLDALRRELPSFPEKYSLNLQYRREEIKVRPDQKIIFYVRILNIKDNWAWLEVTGKNFSLDLDALLHKSSNQWQVKAIILPQYVVCPKTEASLNVKSFIYQTVRETFPAAPSEIFPPINQQIEPILRMFQNAPDMIFVVTYFKEKNGWAWIETSPRTLDGMGQFENINALLQKEPEGWVVRKVQPCCGMSEDDPEVQKAGGFIPLLKKKYPHLPKDLFPKN